MHKTSPAHPYTPHRRQLLRGTHQNPSYLSCFHEIPPPANATISCVDNSSPGPYPQFPGSFHKTPRPRKETLAGIVRRCAVHLTCTHAHIHALTPYLHARKNIDNRWRCEARTSDFGFLEKTHEVMKAHRGVVFRRAIQLKALWFHANTPRAYKHTITLSQILTHTNPLTR